MAYDSSPENRLARVREAIDAALTAQQYNIAGRSVERGRLDRLRQMEKELMAEILSSGSSGSMGSLGIQSPPSR